jgi:hypothetical protein
VICEIGLGIDSEPGCDHLEWLPEFVAFAVILRLAERFLAKMSERR